MNLWKYNEMRWRWEENKENFLNNSSEIANSDQKLLKVDADEKKKKPRMRMVQRETLKKHEFHKNE